MLLRNVPVLVICFGFCHTLFVPEQLPTLLSFIYTNIPPIRKGTDSRVGFGFRLGPNADFQVLFELGPQENTQPIGPQASNSKRATLPGVNAVWEDKVQDIRPQLEHGTGPASNLDIDVINHLRQLYKPKKKVEEIDTES